MINEIDLIVPGREVSLGGFTVKRVLPFSKRRMIGPFIFLDHLGPQVFGAGFGLDIGPHPHIGLSTLTYLLEGRAQHRDSLGTEVVVQPGEVNWMTAGSGVAHSERSVEADVKTERRLHGLQLWVALPDDQEDRDPSFVNVKNAHLPRLKLGECECVLIAGTAHGKVSPVPVYSPLFLIDVHAPREARFTFDPDGQDLALYIAQGSVHLNNEAYGSSQLLVLKPGSALDCSFSAGTRAFVLGGQAFLKPKHVWWNFVSSDKDKIEAAKKRWDSEEFPGVIHESRFSRIPLPQS